MRLLSLTLFFACMNAHASIGDHFNESDKHAHVVVAFQSVFLMERYFLLKGYVKEDAFLVAGAIAGAAALAKESLLDRKFESYDMIAGAAGSLLAGALMAVLPEKSYELEVEGGIARYMPQGAADPGAVAPPASYVLDAQTTIWFPRLLGFHVFSGGMDGIERGNHDKRLQYGLGARFSLLPFLHKPKVWPWLSLWAGADYGLLLFSTEPRAVAYPASAYTMFYSAGLRLSSGRGSFTMQGRYVPYPGQNLVGLVGSFGITF